MHPFSRKYLHKILTLFLCAGALVFAGCHRQGNISYYGTAWVDVTARPGNFTSYIVTIDSITLTRNDGVVVAAASTPEVVDLTQVRNIAELWSSGSIPDGTYTSATITLDYTNAVISTMVNGKPVTASPVTTAVLDAYTHTEATTYSINVQFDPTNLPTITPTYASTSAVLLNVDFDLAASGTVVVGADSAVTVYVRPFVTVAMQSTDARLIRVRGPLINSSVDVNTYTVYIRPFYDEANNIGNLTLFSQPNTIYTLNGKTLVGSKGLDALSVLSAGTTVTAGYTTFQTDYNSSNGATAGRFNLVYVVAGSTLEDVYTEGISGDVISRSGDTITLQGATLFLNTADDFIYQTANCQVLLGAGTTVTADNNASLGTLTASAVSVGQHITARGEYRGTSSFLCDGSVILDSTGTQATNTGSVRLQNTEVWGTLVSSTTGSLALDVQTINNWPVADFDFAGNGSGTVNPANFLIDTGAIALPAGSAAGESLWISGYTTPFGAAPPDFDALSVNNEASVQIAGGQVGGAAPTTPGSNACGIGSQVCDPAVLEVSWGTATKTPFSNISSAGFSLDITGATADIRIGPEVISLATLAPTLVVVPTSLTVTSTFAPRYTVGDPQSATITPSTATSTTFLQSYSAFSSWVSEAQTLVATSPASQMSATGIYDRASNTFTATSIDLVL